uniref:Uncharacterized protein n=1 Tax=Candidatus Kentrum sp. DK TaxID=2126562 RepID=A0A450RUS2_9GAMM|nr:MAG: hypothetical protein BECKDK2373C_GA0170839_100259 [Candidatus Kentron sp. DK]
MGICLFQWSLMQKSGLCPYARKKRAKKRSLYFVAEHFEPP